ncbi:MAG: YfhO family protein [Acidimicrobiales bacterium]
MTDWSRRAVVAIFVGLTLLFFWRPLSGQWSLLPNDLLDNAAPWSSERTPGRAENPWLSDTIDVHSHFVALSEDARSGDLSWWDRSLTGGIPSLKAGLSPLLLPYLLLPAAYAPGVVAALRVLVAGGFLAGYLRRGLGTDRSAALVGAVAYGFTGYLVGWASWPQSNVAAFAPALLWSVESLVSEPRPRRAVPVAGAIAALYLSNFPLAATYVVIAVALYAVARLIALHGGRPLHHVARSALRPTIWGVAGVALGMAAISIYLSEFTTYLDVNDTSYRDARPADSSTGTRFLLTLVLPWAFGSAHQMPAFWADGTNWIEAQGYVGASVLLLALLALAYRRGPGRDLAATVRILWGIAIFGMWISYVGGPLTEALQSLPLLGGNSIGRSRVVTHLAVAALAGLGTQALIDRADDHVDLRRAIRNGAIVAAIAGLAFSPWLVDWGREARARGVLQTTIEQAWLPMLAGIAMIVTIALAVRREQIGPALIGSVSLIVSVELLGFGYSVITVVDADEGRYETASHELVRDLLEPGERLAGDGRTFWANTNQITGHDDVRGHLFYPTGWRQVFEEVQPGAFASPGTITNPWFGPDADASHPALDALAVGLWADSPETPVRGEVFETPRSDVVGGTHGQMVLEGRTEIEIEIPVAGLRGVSIHLDNPPSIFELRVVVGDVIGTRTVRNAATGQRIDIPLAGEHLPPGPRTIELSTSEPLVIATTDGEPDLWRIAPVVDDGLRLVATGAVTLYERPDAAAAWFVPGLLPDEVDLDLHGPGAADSQSVELRTIAGGRVDLVVDTDEPGTIVVSQYAFPGWSATVGGDSASIDEVDGLVTGVAIEPGRHDVVLTYRPQRLGMLTLLTAAALIVLAVLWLTDRGQGRPASRQTSAAA